MLRKQIRLKREYLYHKQNEQKIRDRIKKKQSLLKARQENRRLDTELFREEKQLSKELELNDQNTLVARSHIDNEYAIYKEPKIMITSSRAPSTRLNNFLKEMSIVFPNATRINRGAYVLKDLVDLALKRELTDIVILHEHRGEPDGMIISHLPQGPTIYFGLQDVSLRHDLKQRPDTMSEAFPHLIFHNFNTELGKRVQQIIQKVFPAPQSIDTKRVITFANNNDQIQMRHHVYSKSSHKSVELNEVGPRFTLKPYSIKLGLLTEKEAQQEWVYRAFINTANKNNVL